MIKAELETIVRERLKKAIFSWLFPGCSIGIFIKNHEYYINAGKLTYSFSSANVNENTIYDLASLTKPLLTSLCIYKLCKRGTISLEDRLRDFFKDIAPDKGRIRLKHLLTHTSGLKAIPNLNIVKKNDTAGVIEYISNLPLEFQPGDDYLYSDTGFILLGFIIEIVTGTKLYDAFNQLVLSEYGISGFCINPGHRPKQVAPTQFDFSRSRLKWGIPDDPNAEKLGGLAGHAGLFGSCVEVLNLLKALLSEYKKIEASGNKEHLLVKFLTRSQINPKSTYAYGFDTPSEENSSSGRFFSPRSVGHLGYTGTSFWMDLAREIIIVILSNRVFPVNRESNKNRMKTFRQEIHDLIMALLL